MVTRLGSACFESLRALVGPSVGIDSRHYGPGRRKRAPSKASACVPGPVPDHRPETSVWQTKDPAPSPAPAANPQIMFPIKTYSSFTSARIQPKVNLLHSPTDRNPLSCQVQMHNGKLHIPLRSRPRMQKTCCLGFQQMLRRLHRDKNFGLDLLAPVCRLFRRRYNLTPATNELSRRRS